MSHRKIEDFVHDKDHPASNGAVDTAWFVRTISEGSGREIKGPEPVFLNRHYSDLDKEIETHTQNHPVWEYEHAWPGSDQWRTYNDKDSALLENAAQDLEKTKTHRRFSLTNAWGTYDVSLYATDRPDKFFASHEPRDKSGVHEPYSVYVRRRIMFKAPAKPPPDDLPSTVLRALQASRLRQKKLLEPGDSFAFSPTKNTAPIKIGMYQRPRARTASSASSERSHDRSGLQTFKTTP